VNQRRDHYRVAKLQTIVNEPVIVASAGGALKSPADSMQFLDYSGSLSNLFNKSKLSTTDLLVLASMKNAAKCDK
jgi:hypothetical protein